MEVTVTCEKTAPGEVTWNLYADQSQVPLATGTASSEREAFAHMDEREDWELVDTGGAQFYNEPREDYREAMQIWQTYRYIG